MLGGVFLEFNPPPDPRLVVSLKSCEKVAKKESFQMGFLSKRGVKNSEFTVYQ